jgi:hypothetical protein
VDRVDGGYTIDCGECAMRQTAACDDCVVSFVVNRQPGEALVIDVAEARAMRMLSRAGLVPELRHTPRVAGE